MRHPHGLRAAGGRRPQVISSLFSESTTITTSFNISMPSGIQQNDLLLVVFVTELLTAGARATPPLGWTEVLDNIGRSLNWKIASASEPASYTFSYSTNTRFSAFAICIRNAVFDLVGTIGANANPNVAPSISLSAQDSVLFCHNSNGATASISWTTPTGFQLLNNDSNATQPSSALFYKTNVGSGTTGTVSVTPSSGGGRGFLFAAKPS